MSECVCECVSEWVTNAPIGVLRGSKMGLVGCMCVYVCVCVHVWGAVHTKLPPLCHELHGAEVWARPRRVIAGI